MTRPPTPAEFLEAWNNIGGFSKARLMSADRMKSFLARCREPDWVENWREALEMASRSSFCNGHNERGWRATVDWFLRPGVLTKILEGRYFKIGSKPDTKSAEELEQERIHEQARRAQAERAREQERRQKEEWLRNGKTLRQALAEHQQKQRDADLPTIGDVLEGKS